MNAGSIDPGKLLSRDETAAAIKTEFGLPVTANMLAIAAYRGDGPLYIKIGGAVRYRWADVLAWLDIRAKPQRCTRELNRRYEYATDLGAIV
jgi:hypothetical protein